jgi:ribosomal protein L40E
MKTKTCKKCGIEKPLSAFNTSVSKYIVGGHVKAIHESMRHTCRKCQFPPGWNLKYKKKM